MARPASDRIATLDIVRGVAVMGILFMNIVGFAMPEAAYMNPRAWGGAEGIDLAVYLANLILFDGKMRGLFSVLFGASMLLVIERAEATGRDPARVHYARMVWLLIFGLIHLWLIWWGDILTLYALVGMIAFAMRGQAVDKLLASAAFLLLLQCLVTATLPVAWLSAQHALADPGTAEQARATLARFREGFGVPPASVLAQELTLMRGRYGDIVAARIADTATLPLNALIMVGPETLAYMLLGMAGLRSGMLSGEWPRARYRRWAVIGFAVGVPAYAAVAIWLVVARFSVPSILFGLLLATVPLRPVMIAGWAALIALALRPDGMIATRVAATGRMAFSNYIGTSIVCTLVFYGYGLGWFGHLSRAGLYPIVLAVCAAMLLWSRPWLAQFRYGPLEWLWRSAARGRVEPMLRRG